MRNIIDPKYLMEQQYKTADKLQARINLHSRFGTNPYPWSKWVFDQLSFAPGMRVLEIGCGLGGLWKDNVERLPNGLGVVLGDLSQGMVEIARQKLAGVEDKIEAQFGFTVFDAQVIPLVPNDFDLVIANHMLYHVPKIEVAIKEIRQMLKSSGKLCTATNGFGHMQELFELVQKYWPGFQGHQDQTKRFALENAPGILNKYFNSLEVRIYEENLVVTEAAPIVAYVRSLWDVVDDPGDGRFEELSDYLHCFLTRQGSFKITKSQGIVLCQL